MSVTEASTAAAITASDSQSVAPSRIAQHAAAFNAAVQSGDWRSFADRFTPDATMRVIGVPAGPFVGRAAIAQAYAEQSPTDTLTILLALTKSAET